MLGNSQHALNISERSLCSPVAFIRARKLLGELHPFTVDLLLKSVNDSIFSHSMFMPDAYIYLSASPEVCYERIKIRDRCSEPKISFDYIQALHSEMETQFRAQNFTVRTVEVDGDMSVAEVVSKVMVAFDELYQMRFSAACADGAAAAD